MTTLSNDSCCVIRAEVGDTIHQDADTSLINDHILSLVFDQLSANDLLAIQLVNKQWQQCAWQTIKRVQVIQFRLICSLIRPRKFEKKLFSIKNKSLVIWRNHEKSSQQWLGAVLHLLDRLDDVRFVDFSKLPIHNNPSIVVDIVSRCPHLQRFYFNTLIFTSADDWTRLTELLSPNLTSLAMINIWSTDDDVYKLSGFFTSCQRLAEVFIHSNAGYESLLKAVDHLNPAVFLTVECLSSPQETEVMRLLRRRADHLTVSLVAVIESRRSDFIRFEQLSTLELHCHLSGDLTEDILSFDLVIQVPRLTKLVLDFGCSNGRLPGRIARWFTVMEKLEHLVVDNLRRDDSPLDQQERDFFGVLLSKTPNLTGLAISNKTMTVGESLIPFLSVDALHKLENFELTAKQSHPENAITSVSLLIKTLKEKPKMRRAVFKTVGDEVITDGNSLNE